MTPVPRKYGALQSYQGIALRTATTIKLQLVLLLAQEHEAQKLQAVDL